MKRNDLTKKNLFQSWYDQLHSKHVGSETEEQDSEALARIRELQKKQVEEMDDDTVKNILEAEMSVKEFVPKKTTDGRLMVFGEDLKGALLDAIVTAQIGTTFCKGMCPLSKCPTILDDLFVPGRYVRSKKSARVLLRMMQMHNQNWWSAHKLRESMCLYASSLGQEGSELSPRKTMVDWANRMLEMLWRLSLVDHISSPAVKISIAKAMAFGRPSSEEYCFGNPYIKSQLAVFVERLLAIKSKQVCNTFHSSIMLQFTFS